MPTLIGHSISGIAIGTIFLSRPHALRIILLCVICSIIPDFDAIGFRLGIPYQHWLGHRGFSHSILFAFFVALTATLFTLDIVKPIKKRVMLWSVFFFCVLIHNVLDAMTNGGLGVAFFSPFSDQRFFLPWRPIEVSPLSPRSFFTSRGMTVMASEFIWVVIPSLCLAVWVIGRQRLFGKNKS